MRIWIVAAVFGVTMVGLVRAQQDERLGQAEPSPPQHMNLADLLPEVRAYVKAHREQKAEAIQKAKKRLQRASEELVAIRRGGGGSPRLRRSSANRRSARIEKLRAAQEKQREARSRLRSLKFGPPSAFVPEMTADKGMYKSGVVGKLTGRTYTYEDGDHAGEYKVFQVVDNDEMLIRSVHLRPNVKWVRNRSGQVGLISQGPPIERTGDLLWVKGVSTEEVVDGQTWASNRVFISDGTKTYETLSGSKTVHVLKPFDTGLLPRLYQPERPPVSGDK